MDFVAPAELRAQDVLSCLRPASVKNEARVDLRELRWTEPAGLVAVAAFAESQFAIGRGIWLRGPERDDQSRYLNRMRLGDVVKALDGGHNLLPVTETDQSGRLLELRRFTGDEAADGLAAVVESQLAARGEGVARAMFRGVSEIAQNVAQHSEPGRARAGYIAAVTTKRYGRPRVWFAVADAGVGLLGPLRDQGYSTSREVIDKLLNEGGLSRTGDGGRGYGVHQTAELVLNQRGRILVASGSHAVERNCQKPFAWSSDLEMTGTLVQASLPLPKPRP